MRKERAPHIKRPAAKLVPGMSIFAYNQCCSYFMWLMLELALVDEDEYDTFDHRAIFDILLVMGYKRA